MKRTLSLVLSVILFCSIFSCLSVTVGAASTSDLTFTLNSDGKSYSVTDCNAYATGKLNIPSSYNGKPVTNIGDMALWNCAYLTSIVIPSSVISIGKEAFAFCKSITSITIPNGVKSIGDYAFNDCDNLKYVTIPASVTSLGKAPFKFNKSIVSISVDNNNSKYSSIDGILFNKNKTVLMRYPEAKTNISYTIPNTVTTIAEEAFLDSKKIESIVIPNSVTSMGDWAFAGCEKLKSIIISDNVGNIGNCAFIDCSSLTSITIPDSVTSIGNAAFDFCSNLVSIIIPKSVKSIGKRAFETTTKLKDVCYLGSVSDRKKISFKEDNKQILNATWHYGNIGTPTPITSNEIGGLQVSWNKVANVVKYSVFRRASGSNSWVHVGTTTNTTLFDKNVKSGTYYCYSVRAYNNKGEYSKFISSYTNTRKFMATPQLTTIYNHVNGLAIKWNAVAGITNGYRVYRRGAGSTTWTYLGTTKNLYWIDNGVKNASGEYYRYTVIADGGYHSKFDTTGLYLRRLANPTLTSAVSSTSGITVKWGAVKGTTGYYVYRKTANSSWVRVAAVGGTNSTTYIDKSAVKGTTYTYTVRAVYGATTSSYNSGISCYDKF